MKTGSLLLLFIMFTTCTFVCKKPDDGIGGRGGSWDITLKPRLNGISQGLTGCKVFIKYNATAAPANNAYDDSLNCTVIDTTCYARFSGLKKGDYFFYCTGYSTTIAKAVKGTAQYRITTYDNGGLLIPLSE
jgi:hypothetical protein